MTVSLGHLPVSSVLAGRGSIRQAGEGDAVDGVLPKAVVEPQTPEALADVLAWAARERQTVVIRGGGTKLAWGRRPGAIDLVLSTRHLNRVLVHAHGDLTATIEAGAALRDVNRELERHRQWLPLDAAFPRATIGGTIATNDSGPLRHRHGTPRDLLIGIRLATTDGRLVKAGGNVVKNVAGYDLGKLISGSFGSFAAIVAATFKLAPLPVASQTLVATFLTPDAMAAAATALRNSQLEPTAFDVHVIGVRSEPRNQYRLLLRFDSTPDAIAAQLQRAQGLMSGAKTEVVAAGRDVDVWREVTGLPASASGAVVKISWLVASLGRVLALVDDIGRSGAESIEFAGRAGVGAGFVRIQADPSVQAAAVERLRSTPDVVGNVVLLNAVPAVKDKIDVWGLPGDSGTLLAQLKRAFDPSGVLNAGRGPV